MQGPSRHAITLDFTGGDANAVGAGDSGGWGLSSFPTRSVRSHFTNWNLASELCLSSLSTSTRLGFSCLAIIIAIL